MTDAACRALREVLIAGAGIGGLSLALELGHRGVTSTVLEQAGQLEETGAGIQLSPNAARLLLELGLGDALRPCAVAADAVRVLSANGRELVRVPLGSVTEQRYGAPYWLLYRGDLQAVLLAAVKATPAITVRLGTRVEGFHNTRQGISVQSRTGGQAGVAEGSALIGADGLWSTVRAQMENSLAPRFARRTAWRALMPAGWVRAEFRTPLVHLWLGRNAHIVHYPVKSGAMINIVAIVKDRAQAQGWTEGGRRDDLLASFGDREWDAAARALLNVPEHWLKWSLYDRPPIRPADRGPVTLLGDAAHPVLPFLAQGAALAIEDAWVLAEALAATPHDVSRAMRAYEAQRYGRVRKVRRAARGNGAVYHLSGIPAFFRDRVMQTLGGEGMLQRYDWLYGWTPEKLHKRSLGRL